MFYFSIVFRYRGSSNVYAIFEYCIKVFWCCYLLLLFINVVMIGLLERIYCLV